MNLLDLINTLARRPNPSLTAPEPTQPTGKRKATALEHAPESRPVTAEEIAQGQQACFQLRMELEAFRDALDARREQACDDGDEVLLAELDEQERNLRNQLRIVDRREQEISSRLREVKAIEKSRRFEAAKADLLTAAEEFLPTFILAVRAHQKYLVTRDRVEAAFNSANDFLPGIFALVETDIQEFTSDIERLRHTVLRTNAMPHCTSISSLVEHALKTGEMPAPGAPGGEDVIKVFEQNVTIVTVKSTRDANGRPLKAGAELSLPYPHAMDLVKRGIAKRKL